MATVLANALMLLTAMEASVKTETVWETVAAIRLSTDSVMMSVLVCVWKALVQESRSVTPEFATGPVWEHVEEEAVASTKTAPISVMDIV